MLGEPDFLGRLTFFEKEQVGANARVGFEHAVWQAHDGVEVALHHQVFLEPGLDAFTK